MRFAILAVMMLAWAGGAIARPRESDCRLHRLSAREIARIETFAKSVVEAALDPGTLSTCRERDRDWFTASFDTIHVAQPDGAERWQSFTCSSNYRRTSPWKCEKWNDARGIQAEGMAGSRPLVVVVPPDMDVTLARRRVEQAFALIDLPGETTSCDDISGVNTLRELRVDSDGEKKALGWLRDYLRQGDGNVLLELEPDGFALSRYPFAVHFVLDASDGAPRVRCWNEWEVVVTS